MQPAVERGLVEKNHRLCTREQRVQLSSKVSSLLQQRFWRCFFSVELDAELLVAHCMLIVEATQTIWLHSFRDVSLVPLVDEFAALAQRQVTHRLQLLRMQQLLVNLRAHERRWLNGSARLALQAHSKIAALASEVLHEGSDGRLLYVQHLRHSAE